VLLPLLHKTVAGKLRSIVTHSKGHIAGIPHDIVDAVRHHLAVGERGIVMVVHLDGFSAVGCSVVTSEQAKDFLVPSIDVINIADSSLLRVHAEYGSACLLTPFTQLFNVLELFVAPLAISHRQSLYWLASGVPLSLYDLPDGIEAYLYMNDLQRMQQLRSL